jgi:hypothetical protein
LGHIGLGEEHHSTSRWGGFNQILIKNGIMAILGEGSAILGGDRIMTDPANVVVDDDPTARLLMRCAARATQVRLAVDRD